MTEEIDIYINPVTVNRLKVMLLVEALAINPQLHRVELHRGEHLQPSFQRLNPDGRVPILVASGPANGCTNTIPEQLQLSESGAILQYLAHASGSLFWPQTVAEQAQVFMWLQRMPEHWEQYIGPITQHRLVLPLWGFPSADITDEEVIQMHKALNGFDQRLRGRRVLVGNEITIADIAYASYLLLAREAAIPLQDYSNIGRWLKIISVTSWWQKIREDLGGNLNLNMNTHETLSHK